MQAVVAVAWFKPNACGAASSQMQFEVADYLRKTSLGVL